MIIDSACDQLIINTNSFHIISKSGHSFYVDGALADRMKSSTALDVGSGACLIILGYGAKLILILHQDLLDTNYKQLEPLLQPHQCQAHSVAIDDCAKRHCHINSSRGEQCIQVVDPPITLLYDGYKFYLVLRKPTLDEIEKYPHLELTSPLRYEPDKRVCTCCHTTQANHTDDLQRWRANLGYNTLEVV